MLLLLCPRQRPGIRTEEAASSTTKLNINLPRWALKRSADYLLDFTKADADILAQQDTPLTFRGHVLNATRKQGYYYGNLAIVRFGSELYVAVRKLQFFMTLRSQVPEYPKEEDPSESAVQFSSVALVDVSSSCCPQTSPCAIWSVPMATLVCVPQSLWPMSCATLV